MDDFIQIGENGLIRIDAIKELFVNGAKLVIISDGGTRYENHLDSEEEAIETFNGIMEYMNVVEVVNP